MSISIARSTALTVIAVTTLAACSTEGPTGTGINELPDNLGTEIATSFDANVLAEIAWSANGSEIYFQTDEAQGRLAATSLNGTTRILDGPRDGYYDVIAANDAVSLYFAADRVSGVRSVYRLNLASGALETLTTRASGTIAGAPADGRLAQPSPDGSRVAFAGLPDSVFVLHAASGTRTFVGTGCERVVDWSPDQNTLLCQTGRGGTGVFRTLDIATGTSTIIEIVPLNQGTMQLVDWQASGVWASFINFAGIYAWDPQLHAGVPLLALGGANGTAIDSRNADWTRDGSKIAYWVHQCLVQRGSGACEQGQSLLYVSDLVAGKTGRVAVAKGTQGGQFLALSPDGSRVAYLFNGRIYWQSTALP